MQKNILLLLAIACGSVYAMDQAMEDVDWSDVPTLKKQLEDALRGDDREKAIIAYQRFSYRTRIDNDQLTIEQFLATTQMKVSIGMQLSEKFGMEAAIHARQPTEHVLASLQKSIESDKIGTDFEWAKEFGKDMETPPSPKTLKLNRLKRVQQERHFQQYIKSLQ